MEYQVNGMTVGYGDDVLQLFDAAAALDIGRHRQTEALVKGSAGIDRQLVIDECAAVLDERELAAPVHRCAQQVLRAIDVDPDGAIRRLDAGQPTIERLRRVDRLHEVADQTKDRAADAAAATLDVASRGLDQARSWVRKRKEGTRGRSGPEESDQGEPPA